MTWVLILFLSGSPAPLVAPVEPFTSLTGCALAGQVQAPEYVTTHWPGRDLTRFACVTKRELQMYLLRFGRDA